MRFALLAVMAAFALFAIAASGDPRPADGMSGGQALAQEQVDDHDDSRVEVQLVVAGAAALLVVVIGTTAYLVRRKLGLTEYNPEAHATTHH